jgi:hypothetical protein
MMISGELHAPAALSSEKPLRYPLSKSLCEPHSLFGRLRQDINLPLQGFEARTVQPVA